MSPLFNGTGIGMKYWDSKDPDEILPRSIDWSTRLVAGEDIETSTWIVPEGITKVSESLDSDITTIKLSGGTLGETYKFTNRVVTTTGNTRDMSVKLRIISK